MKKTGIILLCLIAVLVIAAAAVDRFYLTGFEPQFNALEKERIVTANQLATAKIVYENLNHVRDLVFKNMEFPHQQDSIDQDSTYFDFLTECANDLKLKIVSVTPSPPVTSGNITSSSYDLELEGDFFKFGELCAKVENSRRLMSIETFQVAPMELAVSGVPHNREIRISMRVRTYRVRKGGGA
jgi:Tfp pilus assembly protein PilO